MQKFVILAMLTISACAHTARNEARYGAKSNIGVPVSDLVARLGQPTSVLRRDYVRGLWIPYVFESETVSELRLSYVVKRDGLYCTTVYSSDVQGKVVTGVHLSGNGCYDGLATY